MSGPLLANVYLHYAFDLWAQAWRKQQARGEVILVRYADDIVAGFEHQSDAERFLAELRERFARFHLELHPDKTRIIEFGRFAAENRRARGEGKPETFDFLGFTHSCDVTRKGRFIVLRQTAKARMRRKLKEVKAELRRRLHDPVQKSRGVLAPRGRGTLSVLRSAPKWTGAVCVPSWGELAVVARIAPPQSTASADPKAPAAFSGRTQVIVGPVFGGWVK